MASKLLTRLRATGADPPFGSPLGAHPGVALESHYWRVQDERSTRLCGATLCRDAQGGRWASVYVTDARGAVRTAIVDGWEAAADRLDVRAGDALRATREHVRIAVGRVRLEFEVAGGEWPRRALGGLGAGHLVPGLAQYWHPHVLGGLTPAGARVYGEKNWGRGGAPRAWWWGQAFLGEDACVAFAGGTLDLAPVLPSATAFALRLGADLFATTLPLGRVTVETAPGEWRLRAVTAGWRAELHGTASAPPLQLPVPVPGERRTVAGSHQRQDAEVALTLRRGRRTLYEVRASRAALERGGA